MADIQELTPISGIQVWIDAYTNRANGMHFMGHARMVQLLREYLGLRSLLEQAKADPVGLVDDLFTLSMNEEAMEEAIERFKGSATGEALRVVFGAQKSLRARLAAATAVARPSVAEAN